MRVAAVIPAHNEEKNIAQAVLDLANQTYGVERIIVVDDHSTDRTLHVLHELYKNLPQLTILENAKPALRAGAINCGLERLSPDEFGLVVVADADSRFDRGLVEEAVRRFTADRRLGGICSTSGVLRPELTELPFLRRLESWFFWRIQRLNGADFDATRIASVGNVQILHGLCTIFRLQALLDIRGYTPGHMLEDYDLTIRLKQAGWRASYSPFMKAWTSVPLTFRSFFRQRLRWMRGGVDILLKNGLNRHTANNILNHTLFFNPVPGRGILYRLQHWGRRLALAALSGGFASHPGSDGIHLVAVPPALSGQARACRCNRTGFFAAGTVHRRPAVILSVARLLPGTFRAATNMVRE